MVVALHLDTFHEWLSLHVRAVVVFTIATAVAAEAWCVLAAKDLVGWLGSATDPLQPIAIPFNIGAIACIYLLGVYLVGERRSARTRAIVRSGSDNSYGIYLSQMVFITALGGLEWSRLSHIVPWPLLSAGTVALVIAGCVLLTSVLARTSLAVALTGRSRQSWHTLLPEEWRRVPASRRGPAAPEEPAHGEVSSPAGWSCGVSASRGRNGGVAVTSYYLHSIPLKLNAARDCGDFTTGIRQCAGGVSST